MPTIKKNYLVKKKNALNEMRAKGMELQELRFLSIYLSKINKDDKNTRLVRFSLKDFQSILEIEHLELIYFKDVADTLLKRTIHVPVENEDGRIIGFTAFQLFKKCTVITDDPSGGYIEIDAHDDALPLLFDFKNKYFTYPLWNALRVKSTNQLRMYEILKQYEKIGSRILSVEELRSQLGINENEYPRFNNFKQWVLDPCQEALTKYTDIKFSYKPYGKKGKGGKVLALQFTILKNEAYTDKDTTSEQLELISETYDDTNLSEFDKKMLFLADACDNEFTIAELTVLYDLMAQCLPTDTLRSSTKCYDYLLGKYRYMKMYNERKAIKNRYKYMTSIIGKD